MRNRLTPEQLRKRSERSAREDTFPKCKECGNVLGLERVNAGIKRCRGCLPDAELEDRDILARLRYHVSPQIQDPAVRECIQEIIDILTRGNV